MCFSSYGEAVFLVLQSLIIGILILFYTRGSRASAAFAAIYIGVLSYLLSPAAPMMLIWAMQISVMPLIAGSRVGYRFFSCVLYFFYYIFEYSARTPKVA